MTVKLLPRVIAQQLPTNTNENNPTLICVAGIHGNELGGIAASERVSSYLTENSISLTGTFLALRGNLRAQCQGSRYIDHDLNRLWTTQNIEAAKNGDFAKEEYHELCEIDSILKQYQKHHSRYLVDLHSTSAESMPFIVGFSQKSEEAATEFSIPYIVLDTNLISNSLVQYGGTTGFESFTLEGGQHLAQKTIEAHENIIWLMLARIGLIDAKDVPNIAEKKDFFRQLCKGAPKKTEIIHRHEIKNGDNFEMLPGFTNFTKVTKGRVLAHDKHGEIRSPHSGYIFMPLYQKQGNDGFFLLA